MDCWDLCRFVVTIEEGRITKFAGDRHHLVTKGFICKKGKDLVQRMLHPDRIRHPLIKKTIGLLRYHTKKFFISLRINLYPLSLLQK